MTVRTQVASIATALLIGGMSAHAQTASSDVTTLDPNIVAAANCNGMLFAVAMGNFDAGVLSEERARIMLRTTSLSFFLSAIRHQPIEHITQYAADYDVFFSDAYDATYALLASSSFDWDQQAAADVCAARIFDPLTSIPVAELEAAGIDYVDLVESMKVDADRRFDYIMQLVAAME